MKSTSQRKYHGYFIIACGSWSAGDGAGKHGGRWHVSGYASRCTAGASHYMTINEAKASINENLKATTATTVTVVTVGNHGAGTTTSTAEPIRRSFWSRLFGG